ncbi:Carbonic anhydrase 14 [Stylophora pistillata]|uniref:carbonic anhydrase n=1 Tax=Stylophora pistillata TaxID=50429 RepID=A0A2B4S7Z8_STYPI|nr:Carbonic anhydrase 14 [Stylophora pistillata]
MKYQPEIHFVSYNTKYADLGSAVPKSDGLAVLGVFIEVGGSDNPAYEFLKYAEDVIKGGKWKFCLRQILNYTLKVVNENTTANIAALPLSPFFPSNTSKFYRFRIIMDRLFLTVFLCVSLVPLVLSAAWCRLFSAQALEIGQIHFVSYNTKYAGLGSAVPKSDGLAVLGVFIEVGGSDNPAYQFLKHAEDVIKASNKTIIMPFKLEPMLPETRDKFFRYSGSLTTPTCDESVTWTVFKHSVKISETQMGYLRKLEFTSGSRMVNNYRPVQKLNDRKVYNSFDKPASTVASTTAAGAGILDISIGLFSLMLLTALFGR